MRIITHRGLWLKPDERNTRIAFDRSFATGFGAEVDVRDLGGELVVSHDPPTTGALRLTTVLESHANAGHPGELAVNVKADGLCDVLAAAMSATPRWHAFDMSVPDAVQYERAGVPYFARQSELEPSPSLYESARGVWLDSFAHDWFSEGLVRGHLDAGKSVTIVSPELHGRDHAHPWAVWSGWAIRGHDDLAICTDNPLEARELFG